MIHIWSYLCSSPRCSTGLFLQHLKKSHMLVLVLSTVGFSVWKLCYISSVVLSKNPWKILGFEINSGITCDWYILIAPFASFPMQPYCDPRDPGIFVHNIHIFRWRKLCILKSLGFQMFSRWHLLFPKCLYVISSFTSLWDFQKFSKLRKKQWDDHKTTMARWLRETDFC